MADLLDFDVLRGRLIYVYTTYVKEHYPNEVSLLDVDLAMNEFGTVRAAHWHVALCMLGGAMLALVVSAGRYWQCHPGRGLRHLDSDEPAR